jgi:hypothetical protein
VIELRLPELEDHPLGLRIDPIGRLRIEAELRQAIRVIEPGPRGGNAAIDEEPAVRREAWMERQPEEPALVVVGDQRDDRCGDVEERAVAERAAVEGQDSSVLLEDERASGDRWRRDQPDRRLETGDDRLQVDPGRVDRGGRIDARTRRGRAGRRARRWCGRRRAGRGSAS